MHEPEESSGFYELLLEVMDRWESIVKVLLVVLVCLLIVIQLGLRIPALQPYLSSIYRLDGIAVPLDKHSK